MRETAYWVEETLEDGQTRYCVMSQDRHRPAVCVSRTYAAADAAWGQAERLATRGGTGQRTTLPDWATPTGRGHKVAWVVRE